MSPRRESRHAPEPNFRDITELGEAMAHAFQNAIRPPHPQRTPLETMYNMKLDRFMGNEGHEEAEKWLDHIEKTFQNFKKRFVLLEYIDRKKQEFTYLKQKNMSTHEYYRKFTDLSRYDPDTAGNQVEMFRRFKQGTKRKWWTFASMIPCTIYHEFSEILVRIEDSNNLPSNTEEDEDKNDNQKKDDRGKGIFTQGPRKTQNFKKSGASSSSSSRGFSVTGPKRGGRFTGGPRFQRQRDFGGAGGSGAPLCRSCNFRHHGECPNNKDGKKSAFWCILEQFWDEMDCMHLEA
ncbi:unnamed protein product [Malus baccata var. baccata]